MSAIDAAAAAEMIHLTSRRLAEAADELSRLDGIAGDGDHGVNMTTAFLAADAGTATSLSCPGEVFRSVGRAFAEGGGGSAGALFGAFFLALGDGLGSDAEVGPAEFVDALTSGTRRVATVGRSSRGDKTMLDALWPAADAARAATDAGGGCAEMLEAAATAAVSGADGTAAMRAKAGRARYAADGAAGTRDPGAVTVAVMLGAWAEVVAQGVRS